MMATKGVFEKIELDIRLGITREELNKKYNKATVTRVFNKLNKDKAKVSEQKDGINIKDRKLEDDNKIKALIKKVFEIVDENNEYEINVNISKKVGNRIENYKELSDPFELYYDIGKESFVQILASKEREYLIGIIKKYFKFNKKFISNSNNLELSEYIFIETQKTINLGKCFEK